MQNVGKMWISPESGLCFYNNSNWLCLPWSVFVQVHLFQFVLQKEILLQLPWQQNVRLSNESTFNYTEFCDTIMTIHEMYFDRRTNHYINSPVFASLFLARSTISWKGKQNNRKFWEKQLVFGYGSKFYRHIFNSYFDCSARWTQSFFWISGL